MPRRNTIIKKQVGEEIVYSAYTSIPLFIFKGNHDRDSNRAGMEAGAGGKAMEQCCFQLAPHGCSGCLLINCMTACPMVWVLPCLSLVNKMPYSLANSQSNEEILFLEFSPLMRLQVVSCCYKIIEHKGQLLLDD